MKIVVMDDEPTIVLMCRRVEGPGHSVHGFSSVRSALAQLEAEDAECWWSTTRCRS